MDEFAPQSSRQSTDFVNRLILSALGAGCGWTLWSLLDNWSVFVAWSGLYLITLIGVSAFSSVALALCGPLTPIRAIGGALLLAVPVTALVWLASLRYLAPTDVLEDPGIMSVVVVLVVVATPFLSVWLENGRNRPQYTALFDTTWSIVIRYTLGWAFTGLAVLVLVLSNELLKLVGVRILDHLLDTSWAMALFVGAALGLALAIVYELRSRISPHLVLRLLRLLLPVVVVVISVFLLAMPLRGLSQLFGSLSVGAVLLSCSALAITLATVTIDRDADHAATGRFMTGATLLLCLLLPILSGLGGWAIVLRISQYGLTPDRILAAVVAAMLFVQALGYGGAALMWRRDWFALVRRVNLAMAVAAIALAVLWLTPAIDIFRLSTNNQVARYMDGRTGVENVALWEMQHDWGHAGRAGVVRLQGLPPDENSKRLLARIHQAQNAGGLFDFRRADLSPIAEKTMGQVIAVLASNPAFTSQWEDAFYSKRFNRVPAWASGCLKLLPDGRPGCVFVPGPFAPKEDGSEDAIILYLQTAELAKTQYLVLSPNGVLEVGQGYDPIARSTARFSAKELMQAHDGAFQRRPYGNALYIGDTIVVPVY